MEASRWDRVQALFHGAADLDEEARSAQAEAERLFPADAGVRQMRQQLGG